MPSWLTAKVLAWVAGVLGALVIGMGVVIWAQGVRVAKAQNERDKAWNEVAKAKETIKGQVNLLAQCDAATKALDVEWRKRQATADENLAKARAEAAKYKPSHDKLQSLLRAPTPSGADCRKAIAEIRKR